MDKNFTGGVKLYIYLEYIKCLWLLVPCILLLVYCKNMVWPSSLYKNLKLNKQQKKGLYYSAFLIWYIVFCILFSNYIISINLTDNYKISKEVYNYFITTIIFVLVSFLLDIILFKNINISRLNIKGIELSMEEVDKMAEAVIIRKEDYQLLCGIILAQYEVLTNTIDYINTLQFIDEENIYKDFLKNYSDRRVALEIQCYYHSSEGWSELKANNELSDVEFSAIQYSLEMNGVCVPPQDVIRTIYAKIVTSFVFPDLLVLLKGKNGSILYEHEHLVIQNIISAFDKELFILSNNLEEE